MSVEDRVQDWQSGKAVWHRHQQHQYQWAPNWHTMAHQWHQHWRRQPGQRNLAITGQPPPPTSSDRAECQPDCWERGRLELGPSVLNQGPASVLRRIGPRHAAALCDWRLDLRDSWEGQKEGFGTVFWTVSSYSVLLLVSVPWAADWRGATGDTNHPIRYLRTTLTATLQNTADTVQFSVPKVNVMASPRGG